MNELVPTLFLFESPSLVASYLGVVPERPVLRLLLVYVRVVVNVVAAVLSGIHVNYHLVVLDMRIVKLKSQEVGLELPGLVDAMSSQIAKISLQVLRAEALDGAIGSKNVASCWGLRSSNSSSVTLENAVVRRVGVVVWPA